jgi:hypothetical protein
MLKNLLLSAAMLLPTTALAAPSGITLSPDRAITSFHGAPLRGTLPQWIPPPGKTKIIDTLGKGDAYNCCSGWTVSNAQSATGLQQWIAFPFTPTANATVTEIVEAIGYAAGTDSVTVALLADNGGVPGTVLEEKSVGNLETFGVCCSVAVDHLKTGVPVTAGTTYWVGALLPKKKQSTTWDAWNFSSVDTNIVPFAFFNSSGWTLTSGSDAAFAVFGD